MILESVLTKCALKSRMIEMSTNVLCSLAKLWVFRNQSNRNVWRYEVWYKFPMIQKLGDKFPKESFIFNSTYRANCNSLENIIAVAVNQEQIGKEYRYQLVEDNRRVHEVSSFDLVCRSYFEWLSRKLSTVGMVSTNEVYSELDDLGLTITPNF